MSLKHSNVAQPSFGRAVTSYRWALILVTCLFFLWGLSYGLLDVLNKHFQETLHVSKAQSGLLQSAYFGAYFLLALPAAFINKRFGYKVGLLTGLALAAIGAFAFYPASKIMTYEAFLVALFAGYVARFCFDAATTALGRLQ